MKHYFYCGLSDWGSFHGDVISENSVIAMREAREDLNEKIGVGKWTLSKFIIIENVRN